MVGEREERLGTAGLMGCELAGGPMGGSIELSTVTDRSGRKKNQRSSRRLLRTRRSGETVLREWLPSQPADLVIHEAVSTGGIRTKKRRGQGQGPTEASGSAEKGKGEARGKNGMNTFHEYVEVETMTDHKVKAVQPPTFPKKKGCDTMIRTYESKVYDLSLSAPVEEPVASANRGS